MASRPSRLATKTKIMAMMIMKTKNTKMMIGINRINNIIYFLIYSYNIYNKFL